MRETQEDEECRAILDGIAEFLAGLPPEKEPERKMYILTNKQHFTERQPFCIPGFWKAMPVSWDMIFISRPVLYMK